MSVNLGKVIDIISELFKFGKSTVKSIQISGDASLAKRIKKIIEKGDVEKLRKIMDRGAIIIDGKDILGLSIDKDNPGVIISVDLMVQHIQMKKIIKRYKRKGD